MSRFKKKKNFISSGYGIETNVFHLQIIHSKIRSIKKNEVSFKNRRQIIDVDVMLNHVL